MTSKRAIVFGGSGFLGSQVVDELCNRGHKVTVFDIQPSNWKQTGCEFVLGDILDLNKVCKAIEGHDVVFNFAGLADINEAKDRPLETAQLNLIGHINILEGARKAQVKRVVYASTVYVYSESGSFYRVTKQAGEKYTELYFDKFGIPFTILRYGSLYGRRSDHRNAIYRFVKSALDNGEIHYKGTGDEVREYIHVEDAARATVQALGPDFENQHIVITGPQQQRVKDVMAMIVEMLPGRNVKTVFENKDVEAHYSFTPYAYKPRVGRKLLVNPFVDLGQGILDCIHEISEQRPR